MSCGTRAPTSARAIRWRFHSLVVSSVTSTAYCRYCSIGYCVLQLLHCVLPVLLYRLLRAATALLRTARWPVTAPRFGSQPRSPVLRIALAWNPTAEPPGARVRSRRLHRGTAHLLDCGYCELHLRVLPLRQLRYCSRRPLVTADRPVRPSVPSPSCDNLASGLHKRTVLHLLLRILRTATTGTAAGSSSLPGPSEIGRAHV